MEAAERNHRDLCFEAAVGGGIPIIRPLKECLAGNEITEVMGIVNGTTNYILTKMTQEGWDLDDALKHRDWDLQRQIRLQMWRDLTQGVRWQFLLPSHSIPE